jgi:hypothetical protein
VTDPRDDILRWGDGAILAGPRGTASESKPRRSYIRWQLGKKLSSSSPPKHVVVVRGDVGDLRVGVVDMPHKTLGLAGIVESLDILEQRTK